ncbi:centrosome-associated protein 350-like [Heterodontus francisci]|uniref:centrosome-associated protein 350-like n=2 Tax=Heterodontus francisci TaxID=7792 RepID=UPI00355AFBED
MASEEECPAPSCSHAHSDSSIPEEVGSLPAQNVESASVVLRMSTSPDHSVFTDDCYSQDFESVATLNKQSYDEFIKKTQAELSKDLDVACSTKPQIKNLYSTGTEKPKIKPLSLQRTESAKSWKSLTEGERSKASLGSVAKHDQRLSSPEGQKSNCLSELQASDRSKSTIFDSRDWSNNLFLSTLRQKISQRCNFPGI